MDKEKDPLWKAAREGLDKLADDLFAGRSDRDEIVTRLRNGGLSNLLEFREVGVRELINLGIPEDACLILVAKGFVSKEHPRQNIWDGEAYVSRRKTSWEVIDPLSKISISDSEVQKVFRWMGGETLEGETGKWCDPLLDSPNYGALLALITKLFPVNYKYSEKLPMPYSDFYNCHAKYTFFELNSSRLVSIMYAGGRLSHEASLGALIKDMHDLFKADGGRGFAYGVVAADDIPYGDSMEFLRFGFYDPANPVSSTRVGISFGVELLIKMLCATPHELGLV